MEKKKIFIVHSSKDFDIVKRHFIDVLENQLGVQCLYDSRDFVSGKTTIANITDAVNQCHKVFVILTRGSVDRQWVKYETLLALEKSQSSHQLCLTIFLFNVKQTEVEGQTFGVLSNAMTVAVDTNKENFQKKLTEQMRLKIDEVRSIGPIQVAANLSVGQVWSHFTGYSRIVLPELRNRIMCSKWYHPDKFPLVEFNLIPYSAKTVSCLCELDDRIKLEGTLEPIQAARGSFRTRKYHCPVYSIKDEHGEKYYFTGLTPNTMSILQKLEKDSSNWLRQDLVMHEKPRLQITAGERSLQVARFYFAFNRLLNHPLNKDCNHRAKLIAYDDSNEQEEQKAGNVLLKAIKQELEARRMEVEFCQQVPAAELRDLELGGYRGIPSSVQNGASKKLKFDLSLRVPLTTAKGDSVQLEEHFRQMEIERAVKRMKDKKNYQRTVYIDYIPHIPQDAKTAADLKQFLKDHEFIVWEEPQSGSYIQILEQAMKKCQWAIFILSKFSIHDPECRLLQFRCRAVLHTCVEKNCVRVIPILEDLNEEKIIDDLKPVTYLSKDERRYKDKLLQTLSCGSIPMELIISARDVHQGLAWAYVLNYLKSIVPEHVKKLKELKEKLESTHKCKVYTKMFIIVPSSCATRSLKSLDKDDQGHLIDERFQQQEEIYFTVTTETKREYQLITYKIRADKQEYIVAVEYPNAVLCLQEMSELWNLSGLLKEHLHMEAWRFKELAQQIIDASELHDQAMLLYYDDSQLTIVDAMLFVLENEESV